MGGGGGKNKTKQNKPPQSQAVAHTVKRIIIIRKDPVQAPTPTCRRETLQKVK